MLTLERLLGALAGRPDITALLRDFVPPPRFSSKRFEHYHPLHPSQAEADARLRGLATRLRAPERSRRSGGFFRWRRAAAEQEGVYLDGGFGVGKTHLLAALWHEAPEPKAYLSFDELMYFIGMIGPAAAADALGGSRLIAVDEWELDDPGNLKLAVAFLRAVAPGGSLLAVTSNTLPIELGAGRFSQKDFRAEIEELADRFEVITISGEDYRHRNFALEPGREYFTDPTEAARVLRNPPPAALLTSLPLLLSALGRIHPMRYREAARRLDFLLVEKIDRIPSAPDALRWVHFIDSIYDAGVPFAATGEIPLGEIFSEEWLKGPFGKKLSRSLSRMEEMLGERQRPETGSGAKRSFRSRTQS